MRFLRLALVLAALIPLAGAAATPGPQVPLTSTSGLVRIQLDGGGSDSIETTGPLPVVLPFNLSTGGCSSFGTATLDNVGGALELTFTGVSLSDGCFLDAAGELDDLEFQVPDIGDTLTPILGSISGATIATGGVTEVNRRGSWASVYASANLGDEVFSEGVNARPFGGPAFYLPGDAVSIVVGEPPAKLTVDWSTPTGNPGTLDATFLLEAFLPPTAAPPAPALSASGRVALGVALLGVAGFFASRRVRAV